VATVQNRGSAGSACLAGSMPEPLEIEDGNRKLTMRQGRSHVCCRMTTAASILAFVGAAVVFFSGKPWQQQLNLDPARSSSRSLRKVNAEADPFWGCGLLGALPGISETGETTAETQRFIDSLKKSSSFQKVTFWNWNLAPMTTDKGPEYLSKDFLFVPEVWGANAVNDEWVRRAGEVGFLDSNGKRSPAEMANIFLGMNEPDIQGSCMGNMFGTCVRPCTPQAVQRNDCPVADNGVGMTPREPNSQGMCDCWSRSVATGCGFWPVQGCDAQQPLPKLWSQERKCIQTVMQNWKKTAQIAWRKGYKYLSTPLLAVNVSYADKFIERACKCRGSSCKCTDASCGCPVYVGLHFYAFDCSPRNAYPQFEERIKGIGALMEKYPFLKGAIINEVGMLNCGFTEQDPICVPDSGKYPAKDAPDFGCPSNEELPDGLATFISNMVELAAGVTTSDGRPVVKSFSWFNIDRDGGTYNLRLFNDDGSINKVGEAYMQSCEKWGEMML